MTTKNRKKRAGDAGFKPGRRSVLIGASAASLAAVASFRKAHAFEEAMNGEGADAAAPKAPYVLEKDSEKVSQSARVHHGKGTLGVRYFFYPDEFPKPAILMSYILPPGASEGVHTHRPGDLKEGSYDEFYYILSGSGEMEIAGKKIPVTAGDYIFTPNGVAHGIENTSAEGDMKVHLVAMRR